MNVGLKPVWAGRNMRLDPFRLPQAVSYATRDDFGDVTFLIDRRGATVRRILSGTLDTISAILREYERPEDIGEAIRHFWRFQLAGLQALLVEGSREPDQT